MFAVDCRTIIDLPEFAYVDNLRVLVQTLRARRAKGLSTKVVIVSDQFKSTIVDMLSEAFKLEGDDYRMFQANRKFKIRIDTFKTKLTDKQFRVSLRAYTAIHGQPDIIVNMNTLLDGFDMDTYPGPKSVITKAILHLILTTIPNNTMFMATLPSSPEVRDDLLNNSSYPPINNLGR